MLPYALFKKHFEPKFDIVETHVKLTGYGGSNIPVKGEVKLNCEYNDIAINSTFIIIIPLNVKPVIGLKTSCKLGIVNRQSKVSAVNVCNREVSKVSDNLSSRNETGAVDIHNGNHSITTQHHDDGVGSSKMGESKCESRVNMCRVQNPEICEQEECVVDNPATSNPYTSGQVNVRCPIDKINSFSVLQDFGDVFDNKEVGCLKKPYDIKLKKDDVPVVHAPRKIPFTLRDKIIK